MSELRKDPIVGRWVIISSERGRRPSDWATEANIKRAGNCPFCPGNEQETPAEILIFKADKRSKNQTDWDIRVVPNKFPALGIEGDLSPRGYGNYDTMNGIGAHEVIVETPEHARDLADLDTNRIRDILKIYRLRILDLKQDARLQFVLIFKNQGAAAGASLTHSHSQLIATPIVPKRVMEEIARIFIAKKNAVFFAI